MRKNIIIAIPIYKDRMSHLEEFNIKHSYKILSTYNIYFIAPRSLNLNYYKKNFKNINFELFDDEFFLSISDYNRLMLSKYFYQRFLAYDYMLILQPDAYVFKDKLEEWCQKGYDYVGAPWIPRKCYTLFPLNIFSIVRTLLYKSISKYHNSSHKIEYYVGNGGFSLRKIARFYQILVDNDRQIEIYLKNCNNHKYNEDVFWGYQMKVAGKLSTPSYKEAINFSFEKNPGYCYELNNNNLPFGCHAWHLYKHAKFWNKYIMYGKSLKTN